MKILQNISYNLQLTNFNKSIEVQSWKLNSKNIGIKMEQQKLFKQICEKDKLILSLSKINNKLINQNKWTIQKYQMQLQYLVTRIVKSECNAQVNSTTLENNIEAYHSIIKNLMASFESGPQHKSQSRLKEMQSSPIKEEIQYIAVEKEEIQSSPVLEEDIQYIPVQEKIESSSVQKVKISPLPFTIKSSQRRVNLAISLKQNRKQTTQSQDQLTKPQSILLIRSPDIWCNPDNDWQNICQFAIET